MSPETLQAARTPFFTTKEKSGGSGLGLSICQLLVSEQGAVLDIESTPGAGTRVTVRLGVATPAPGSEAGALAS